MTFWLKSRFIPSLFAALLSFALLTPAQAEVFTQTYTINGSDDFDLMAKMMIGPGVIRYPYGELVTQQDTSYQVGVFSNLYAKAIPTFTNGVILATGKLAAHGSLSNETAHCVWPDEKLIDDYDGDEDLQQYLKKTLLNQAGVVLQIQPKNKTINIPFVFASEEYYYQTGTKPTPSRPLLKKYLDHSDKLVVFLAKKEDVDAGKGMTNNIALLPGGGIVEVATVNQHTNTEYFLSNVCTNNAGNLSFPASDIPLPMEFNGAITGLVAYAEGLDTGKVYVVKIIIGDHADNTINSAVFLRDRGITSGADLKVDVTGPSALTVSGPVTFTNTLSNVGPATADGVVVTNWLPEGVSVATAASEVGSVSAMQTIGTTNYFVWTVGDRFKPGSNAVMRIDCTLPVAGSYTNLAHVVTDTGDYEPSNDTDDHVVTVGSLPELTIDLISTNKCYGESMWLDPMTYLAKIDGTNDTARLTGFTVSFTNAAGAVVDPTPTNAAAKVGKYGITLTNLTFEPVGVFSDRVTVNGGIFEITNRCLTITANDTNKVYGTTIDLAQDAFKITAGSLVDGETIIQVTLTSKTGAAGNTKASVGIYVDELKPDFPVTGAGGFDPNNYAISFSNGTLTVTKATLAVAAPNIVKVYDGAGTNVTAAIVGDQPPEGNVPTYLYSTTEDGPYVEWQNLQFTNVVFKEGSVSSNQVWYKVSTTPENYFAATNWAWITITPRPLTVRADDAKKKPGTPDPDPFAWSVVDPTTTIVAGEETAVYAALTNDVKVSEKLDRTPTGESKGDYTITTNAPFAALTTGVLANYALAFTPGMLTILDKDPLTFYVASTNVAYGAEVPTVFWFDHTVPAAYDPNKVTGLATVQFKTTYCAKAPCVGSPYTIMTNSELSSVAYAIAVVPGTLTVTQRCVTVKSESASKVYDGAPLSTNEVKVVAGSFADGEGVEGYGFASRTDVGTSDNAFSCKAKEGTATDLGNYSIVSSNGTLEVTRAPILPVKPGEEPPADEAWTRVENVIKCYDGLGTNVWPTSGKIVAGNTPTYRYGTSETGPFDLEWEELQFTNVVFDAHGNVTSNPVWYVVTTWNGTAANYFAATNSAYVMITQRCVTVTADNTNKVYGTAITLKGTEFTTDPATLPNGETITSVTLSCDQAATPDAAVGDYPIAPSDPQGENGFNPSNYQFTFNPGTLTVTKASLAVAAPNIVKVYDGAGTNVTAAIIGDQPLEGNVPTYLYSTAQNGPYVEWQDLQYTNVVFNGASITSNRVWYTVSTEPENYFAATNWAWVTITPRPLTVAADNATKKPGAPDPDPFAWSVVDPSATIVAGEETAVYLSLSNDVKVSEKLYRTPSGETKGDYTITTNAPFATLTTGVLANYALAFTPGTLTITDKDALTFYVASTNVAYGAEVPTGFLFDHTDPETYDSEKITGLDMVQFKTTYCEKAPCSGSPYAITTNSALTSVAYDITVVPGTLTVTQRCVTVKSESAVKVYDGTPLSTNEIKVIAGSFAADEGVEGYDVASRTDVGTSDNTFSCKAKEGTMTDLSNYSIVSSNGTLEVTRAPILPVKPGEVLPTDPAKAWTQAANIIKCYDGFGTNIWPEASVVPGNVASYLFSTNAAGPFVTWENLQFTNVVFDTDGNVTSNQVYYTITTDKAGIENYFAATNYAYVTITQRCVTIEVNDATWQVGNEKPTYSFADFTSQLAAGDVVTDVTGGTESYSNKVWETAVPTKTDAGTYADEIWIRADSLSGAKKGNYQIEIDPGDLEIKGGEANLVTTITATLNWDTGLEDFSMTVRNDGDGSVAAEDNYWVQLADGPAASGDKASVAKSYYLDSPTGQLAGGTNYVDLTTAVKTALKKVGNRDEVFDPGESITVGGVSVYHWKRWKPELFIDMNNFFVSGNLGGPTSVSAAVPTLSLVGEASCLTPVDADVSSASEQDQTVLSPAPTLHSNSDANETFASTGAVVYDGILTLEGELAGTIRVNLGKANKKTGLSKLTATITPVGAKRVSVSGNFDTAGTSFAAKVKDSRELALELSADGISGTFGDYAIDGARNRYSSKTAEDKSVVAEADQWIGTYTVACPVAAAKGLTALPGTAVTGLASLAGYDTFTLKIAKKGRATIAGRLADGTTVSASAQMIIGTDGCCVPVVWSKKTVTRTFCVWFGHGKDAAPTVDADVSSASIEVIGLDNAIISPVGNLADAAVFTFDAEALSAQLTNEMVAVLSDYLPAGAEILPDGKKWIVMPDANGKAMKTGALVWDRKACAVNEAKSKIVGYNVPALKLTYTTNTGCFTGSFKVFTVVKNALRTTTVTVRGIVVDGIGYGTAAAKGLAALPVMIE